MGNHNNQKNIKCIEIAKFYLIHDRSKTGHPGLIVWKDDEANLYLAIRFGTSQNDKNIPLVNKLNKNIEKHYFYKRPLLLKRKDIGSEWFFDYELSSNDKDIIKQYITNTPILSKNINRHDRRYYSLAVKQNKIKTVI